MARNSLRHQGQDLWPGADADAWMQCGPRSRWHRSRAAVEHPRSVVLAHAIRSRAKEAHCAGADTLQTDFRERGREPQRHAEPANQTANEQPSSIAYEMALISSPLIDWFGRTGVIMALAAVKSAVAPFLSRPCWIVQNCRGSPSPRTVENRQTTSSVRTKLGMELIAGLTTIRAFPSTSGAQCHRVIRLQC